MLANFVAFFVRHSKLTIIGWVLAVVFGAFSYQVLMPREGFPPVDVPFVVVGGGYFVDDPAAVDADVTQPITEALEELDGVESVSSTSRATSFTVFANVGLDNTSAEYAPKIEQRLDELGLPEEAQYQVLSIDASKFLAENYDLLIAVYGDRSGAELQAAGEDLAAAMSHPDLAEVKVEPLIETGVNPQTGEEVEVETAFTQVIGDQGAFEESATVGVKGVEGADSIAVRDAAANALDQAIDNGALPDGVSAVIAIDSATVVEQQISELQSNVLTGLIAVAIVAFLLISWRASVITAVFLVSVLAVSVGVLYVFGISLNTISLFALILALGLFVDDAIVITEAIDAFRERHEDAGVIETVKNAIRRVGSASVSGTLTTVLVFVPMLFISGILGGFIRILPTTVIISLLVSLLLSLIVIPVISRYVLLSAPESRGVLDPIERRVGRFLGSLPRLRSTADIVTGVSLFLLSIVALFVALGVFAPRLGLNIFPPAKDSITIGVEFAFAPGTDIEQAKELALDANREAADILGDNLEEGYLYLGNASEAIAQYTLTPIGDRPTVHELVDQLEPISENFEGGRVVFAAVSNGPPEQQLPFRMQVFSEDVTVSGFAAREIVDDLNSADLELPSGTTFEVLETEVIFEDVIARDGGRRYVEVGAGFDNDETTSVLAATQEYIEQNYDADRLAELGLADDALGFDFGLESDNQESFNSLPIAFGFALLAMLLLLIIQFRSLVQWILVFLAIPFSFFGVFGGLLLTDNPLSFFVMLGLIGLIGIAVNNTILLVDYANQERAAGRGKRDAISEAIRRRFRPLVATSLTTVAGLLPLALSDPFWEGLAFTIIFGLLSSTFFVLVSFPFYYLIIESLRELVNTPWRRKAATASVTPEMDTPTDA